MSKVLVTGGTGFIGSALTARLLKVGHQVRVMARRPSSRAARLLESAGAEIVPGNLVEASNLPYALEGCDGLFHLAAKFDIGTWDRPGMYATNVEGTESLFAASRAAGVSRIVHMSTVLALGPTAAGPHPAPPPSPESLHGPPREHFTGSFEETKYLAQRIALLHARQGAHVLIVCPGTVLGEEDPSQLGTALRLNMRGQLPFLTAGSSCFSFVGLEDVVDGLLLVYERGRPGVIYPLVSEVLSLEELSRLAAEVAGVSPPRWDLPEWVARLGLPFVNLLARFVGGRRIYTREAMAILACDWGYDAAITRKELGWQCQTIADVLKALVAHL